VDPGRSSRDEGSLRSLGRSPRRLRAARTVPIPPTLGSPVNGRHAPSKLCSPRESVRTTTSCPGRAEAAPSVLSWDSCPPELSPPRFRVRSLAPTHAGARRPLLHTSPGFQPSRLHAATRTPTPGFANPGSADAQWSIEPRAPPSGGDPAHGTLRERPCASHQLRPRPCDR